mmetsp:Transcript_17359/g.37626  ORF Transcript_17359/g.37626 Transcript_17359/m.37626 type:complete len:214 (-) Transcript_17359:386-1027(-)
MRVIPIMNENFDYLRSTTTSAGSTQQRRCCHSSCLRLRGSQAWAPNRIRSCNSSSSSMEMGWVPRRTTAGRHILPPTSTRCRHTPSKALSPGGRARSWSSQQVPEFEAASIAPPIERGSRWWREGSTRNSTLNLSVRSASNAELHLQFRLCACFVAPSYAATRIVAASMVMAMVRLLDMPRNVAQEFVCSCSCQILWCTSLPTTTSHVGAASI